MNQEECDIRKNFILESTTIYHADKSVFYEKCISYLKKIEGFIVNNAAITGVQYNCTIIEKNEPDYIKLIYIKAQGHHYMTDPINSIIEIFLYQIDENVELIVKMIPKKVSLDFNISKERVYWASFILELWRGVGVEVTEQKMDQLFPDKKEYDVMIRDRDRFEKNIEKIFLIAYILIVLFFIAFLIINTS